jgi:ribosome-associated heat shock protein Hsp15
MKNSDPNQVRIDKWLWAARFYKTRTIAVKAIKNGQVSRAKNTLKPASVICTGDILSIKKGLYRITIEVTQVREKRVSATLAQEMFEETPASIIERKALAEQLASQPKVFQERQKPDKRGVRNNLALKRGE